MKLDDIDPQLVEGAVFGRLVEDFLGSDVGRYLVAKAEAEAEEATDLLKKVWPWRTRRIQQLQNRIAVAESIQQWLGDAIVEGHNAMNLIEEGDG